MQIKCKFLNFRKMRSIYITTISLLLTLTAISQISYDTTYTKEWNDNTESWIYYDRIISSYSNENLASELIQIFENGSWINYNETFFAYNNGNLIEEVERYWDDRHNEWVDNYRKLYTYENEKLTQVLHQYIFKGNYVNSQREIMNYTEDGQLIERVVQKYEEAWTNFLKYQYYYLTNDLIFEENLTYWNNDNWEAESFSVKFIYDNQGNIVNKVKTKNCGAKEKNLIQEEYYYSSTNRLVKHILSEWNSKRGKWVDRNRADYTNDMDGYIVSMLNQNKSKKQWTNVLFTEFTGSNEPITGMDIADGMSFSIYPINFGKKAMIEFDNPYNETYFVKVMDTNGQLIGSATTSNNEVSVDARFLNRGLYFVELQGRNLYSGKFSIE